MSLDHDAQLIEAVAVRRQRLLTSLTYGSNPTEQRWRGRGRLVLLGTALAAVICAFCVLMSLVVSILTAWLDNREEMEQQREQQRIEQQQRQEERERPSQYSTRIGR
ncbi:hypothetical protein [Micrococcus lylae]|uniref:Uncharacterized protein n=1 Tax=Micrococcus lylae TaxID=1273 RepID=A0ABY2JWT7_9MICC|nr:hypothetical protein [Micrococcus lylae]TFH97904.1 hypothetical protein E4A49_11315 [Micrococcus lylae]